MAALQQLGHYLLLPHHHWVVQGKEILQYPADGHTFSVVWATAKPTTKDTRCFVVVPGLWSPPHFKYIQGFVNYCRVRGPTCVINYPLTVDAATIDTLPDYSSGCYLQYYLEKLKESWPKLQIE